MMVVVVVVMMVVVVVVVVLEVNLVELVEPPYIVSTMSLTVLPPPRLLTVCHGDLWSGTLLLLPRPSDGDSPGLVCSLLQPRAAAALSPATDLVHLLLTSGPGEITSTGGEYCTSETLLEIVLFFIFPEHIDLKSLSFSMKFPSQSPDNTQIKSV